MKHLGKIKWFVAAVALYFLFVGAPDLMWILSHRPNFSATPQETARKLEVAVGSGDTTAIAALFSNRQTFDKFMSVTKDSVSSSLNSTALKRTASQSALEAWQIWFSTHGFSKLIFKTNSSGTYCVDKADSFVLGFDYEGADENSGYLIDHCGYGI